MSTNNQPIILVVDDVPDNIQVLANCLKQTYQLRVATNGRDCIKMAKLSPQPDLILLDVVMPGMGGIEVLQRLRKDIETNIIPVIFVTAKSDKEDEEVGLNAGAVDYIIKPVQPAIVLARVKTHITLKQQRDELIKMALFDQLTGLYNRHYLNEAADNKIANAKRQGLSLCILMLDIDYFKLINDEHGHPVGDIVLKQVADLLLEHSRQEDVVARLGGEEFILLLDYCDLDASIKKADFIRQKIEELKPSGLKVTASFGVARLDEHSSNFEKLLKHVDEAVYLAKKSGRNTVGTYFAETSD